jgi:hypothetical protein
MKAILKQIKEFIYESANILEPVKCIICGQYINGSYILDSWNQPAHDYHKILSCFSCGRIIAKNGLILSDGRQVCEQCQPSVVQTVKQINWVDKKVRSILARVGIDNIPQNVPIEIIDSYQLMKIQGNKEIDANQRGLAMFNQTISNGRTKTEHKVFILDYLPKFAFAGVFAHEILHVWQNEYGISPPKDICEGFCNLGSFAVYSDINNPAALQLIDQMEKSPDPVYGEGYRIVKRHLDKNGWQAVIDKIKKYKT